MIILNEATCGQNTYVVSICNAQYTVSARTEQDAIDIVADYLESHGLSDFYFDTTTIKVLAECLHYGTATNFAKENNLTRCGSNGIYVEITKVEEL